MNKIDRSFDDYRILYSLESLLRAKAASQSKKGLKDFEGAIKDVRTYFHSFKDTRLLKYLYCYLYDIFDDDYISIDISVVNGDRISVVTSQINERGKICYNIDLLSVVEDDELPIKRENCVIEMDRGNNKAVLSRQVSYNTDSGMEMVLLDGDANTVDVSRVSSLFEETTNIKSSRISFRDFKDPLLITEIDISDDPIVKHYIGSIDRINSIVKEKETSIDDYKKAYGLLHRELRNSITHNRLNYSEYLMDTIIPYMYDVSGYSNEKKEFELDYDYDNSIDDEVIDFISNKNITDFTESYNDIMDFIEKKKKDKNRGSK